MILIERKTNWALAVIATGYNTWHLSYFWLRGKNLVNSLLVYFIKWLNRPEFYHRGKLNAKTYLAIFFIATTIAIGATTSLATPAFADKTDKNNADKGLEEADENIHENTGPPVPSDQDIRFHEGTCKGGHTTDALEGLGGCDELTEPGESENRP